MLQEALRVDPDLSDAVKTVKVLKQSATRKEEASQLFKSQ